MVVIRLARGGAKKRPFYHIVVADKRCARDGRFIECLGYFNPQASDSKSNIELNREKLESWVKKGAQMSDRVKKILTDWDKKNK